MNNDLVKIYRSKSKLYKYFYNIMPIENIPSVIKNGILSYDKASSVAHTSVAMSRVQARRERVHIPNGGNLHSYANLYFTYHNPMMYKRREQAYSLCVLVIDPAVIYSDGCVLSDRNAAADLVKFFTPEIGLDKIDFDLVFAEDWNDTNPYKLSANRAVKCAEILIPSCVAYNYIVGAYVVNQEAKQHLINLGFDKKIIIQPDVFYG